MSESAAEHGDPPPTRPVPTEGTLCVDIGGSGVKGATVGADGAAIGERARIPVTYPCAPDRLVDMIAEIASKSAPAHRVSLGFPGMVRSGIVLSAPHFRTVGGPGTDVDPQLAAAWNRFPLAQRVELRIGLQCRLGNDADVQGLAAIAGEGLELVITLGTGIGTAVFLDGELGPHIELSHHPLRKGKTYNEVVGETARKKLGDDKWSRRVDETVGVLADLVFFDRLYVGGGNAKHLTSEFTRDATIVPNVDGILGGAKLWSLARVP